MIDRFPLTWPDGYKRTAPGARINSKFKQSMERAQQTLNLEIDRLRASDLIISTNLRTRNDGGYYSADLARKEEDPGVAIYFKHKGRQMSMCCDQYNRVWENIYALAMAIEALRGIDRWGVSDFLERAFTGFTAIEEKSTFNQKSIYEILGLESRPESVDQVHRAYRVKAKIVHPDMPGGSAPAFKDLQTAYSQILSTYKTQS